MMTIRKTILLLIFTVLSGCGNNKAYTCKVDEQLLDLDLACFLDEDCPCGTHCDMGMCGYECTSNRDCDNGSKCDAFGRCSDKKSPSHALPPATAPGGTLELQTPSLVLRDAGETRALALRATHVNSGSIRVKAGPDLHDLHDLPDLPDEVGA